MSDELARRPAITLLYTMVPTEAACDSGEHAFTFNKDNSVSLMVSGGGRYEHGLWDYGKDAFVASCASGDVHYSIERVNVPNMRNWQLILLAPIAVVPWYARWCQMFMKMERLTRLQVVSGEFARLRVKTADGLFVSTARLGEYACATVPASVDSSLFSQRKYMLGKFGMATVQRHCETSKVTMSPAAASVLADYYNSGAEREADTVFAVSYGLGNYQASGPRFDDMAAPSMYAFASPLILGGAYAPTKCFNNDKAAVDGRVELVRGAEPTENTEFAERCQREFLEFVMPVAGTCVVEDDDEVWLRQARPSQRNILSNALCWFRAVIEDKIKIFVKVEAMSGPVDARIISPVDPVRKLEYSKIIYAFVEYCKPYMPWYAFGKTPREIAERVAEICREADSVTISDGSRWDGHVNCFSRDFERKALARAFGPSRCVPVLEEHALHFDRLARTPFGVEFETRSSRSSGSPETSIGNSLTNGVIIYTGLRFDRYTPQQAWDRIGAVGGDDGLGRDVKRASLIRAAAIYGQVFEAETIERNQDGVTFLNRRFTREVWYGNPNSSCNVARAIVKLHVGVIRPRNEVQALSFMRARAMGYALSDANTPILGRLCREILHRVSYAREDAEAERLVSYYVDLPESEQFPNDVCDDPPFQPEMVDFDEGRLWGFLEENPAARSLLSLPCCMKVEAKRPRVDTDVDGELVAGRDAVIKPAVPSREGRPALSAEVGKAKKPPGRPPGRPPGAGPARAAFFRSMVKVVMLLCMLATAAVGCPGGGSRVVHNSTTTTTIFNNFTDDMGRRGKSTPATKSRKPRAAEGRAVARAAADAAMLANSGRARKAIAPSPPSREGRGPLRGAAGGGAGTNGYLASILDPWMSPAQIPDATTMPSATVKSEHRILITTDAQGSAMYAITPALFNGGLKLGLDTLGNATYYGAASAALPAGFAGATVFSTTNTVFANNLSTMASEVRPVSCGVRWISTEAALNAKGELAICQLGASSVPGTGAFVAAGGTPITTLINGLASATQAINVNIVFDMRHAQMQPAVEEACAIWKPELPNSAAYYAASGNGEPCVGFSNNAYTDANGLEIAYLPGQPYERVVRVDGTTSGVAANSIQPNPNRLPYLLFSYTGCSNSATIGELEITINYEYIPEEGTGNLIPTTVSVSNPIELAHTSNIVEIVPNVMYPKIPNDPPSRALAAAQRAAPSSLYSGGAVTKDGVEGTSFLKKIGSLAAGASPFLAKIPGIGSILSTGAALIGNLLS